MPEKTQVPVKPAETIEVETTVVVRDAYTHTKCGCNGKISTSAAESQARDPRFLVSLVCAVCCGTFPVSEFVWKDTNLVVGS